MLQTVVRPYSDVQLGIVNRSMGMECSIWTLKRCKICYAHYKVVASNSSHFKSFLNKKINTSRFIHAKRTDFGAAEHALAWRDQSQFSSQLSQYKNKLTWHDYWHRYCSNSRRCCAWGWRRAAWFMLILPDKRQSVHSNQIPVSRGSASPVPRHSKRHNQYVFFRAQQSKGRLRLRSSNDLFQIQHWYNFSQII